MVALAVWPAAAGEPFPAERSDPRLPAPRRLAARADVSGAYVPEVAGLANGPTGAFEGALGWNLALTRTLGLSGRHGVGHLSWGTLSILTLNRKKLSPKTLPTVENLARVHSRAHLDIPELTKRDMLLENRAENTCKIFSSSFESWITREITAIEGEEESEASVQAWVHAGGRDDLEAITGLNEMSFELVVSTTFELLMRALF